MDIGFIGLGRMGMHMVIRLLQHQHRVVVYNRTAAKMQQAQQHGALPATGLQDICRQLSAPRVVWCMLPAGDPTETHIQELAGYLSSGDILIDGGNAYYKDSIRRAAWLKDKGIHFLDIGVSGGIWGLEQGYCMMVGGDRAVFDTIQPVLESLAPADGYAHVGKSGAGHFVKMVHNGIEYAMLQAYGEGFEILQAKEEFDIPLHTVAHLWNQGSVIRSWLLELTEQVFAQSETLEEIADYVEDSGEGRWTVAEALEEDVPAPVITLSLLERLRSRQDSSFSAKVIAALRHAFGGHPYGS